MASLVLPDMRGKILAFTGHRPDKLGGYGLAVDLGLVALAEEVLTQTQPKQVISGMALGWDQAVARAAISYRIPVIAAIPCRDHSLAWPPLARTKYRELLAQCLEVHLITDAPYSAGLMQIRNRWMVNCAQGLCELWNGSSGGTKNCHDYAWDSNKDIEIFNVWDLWTSSYDPNRPLE